MSSWSAPWNAAKPQVEEIIEPVQEVIEEPTQTPEPELVVETPVVETPVKKASTKKIAETPAE